MGLFFMSCMASWMTWALPSSPGLPCPPAQSCVLLEANKGAQRCQPCVAKMPAFLRSQQGCSKMPALALISSHPPGSRHAVPRGAREHAGRA